MYKLFTPNTVKILKRIHLYLILIILFQFKSAYSQIPAFPGAQGYGSMTPGGRGGKIIEVTNLNDSGPGSLRYALETSGKRIVVFRTGGTINLTSDIRIDHPFVTIAGQTAPGDGILLKGAGIRIRTHDIIMRGLRIRVGDSADGPDPENRDGIGIANNDQPTYNIIIDHCSISWAIDENIQLYYENYNITIQWSIISEGLRYSLHPEGEHSNGILVGSSGISRDISLHHNLFAHNLRRNPVISELNTAEVINNVIYNWDLGTTIAGNANVIGNIYQAGINTGNSKAIQFRHWEDSDLIGLLYVKDNVGPGRTTNSGDDWLVVDDSGINPQEHRSYNPVAPLSNAVINDVDSVLNLVINNSGAIAPDHDAVDKRIINEVMNKTGSFIDSQNEAGGWPTLNPGTALEDSDHDGIPDNWEQLRGLDPNNPDDGNNDPDGNGYSNVEEYLNSLIRMPFNLDTEKPESPVNIKIY